MFLFATIFVVGFFLFYTLLALAIIYHLWRYAFPEHPAPLNITIGFLALSGILYFLAINRLLEIPW